MLFVVVVVVVVNKLLIGHKQVMELVVVSRGSQIAKRVNKRLLAIWLNVVGVRHAVGQKIGKS